MRHRTQTALMILQAYAGLVTSAASGAFAAAPIIVPSTLPRVGTVDPRFQSYNIEMVEVTGGWFWKPYRSHAGTPPPRSVDAPPGTDTSLFQYRPPIDLGSAKLRKLAAALAPAYLRVSGTWANSTYFADVDDPPSAPPVGFSGVLTRRQWQGVVDFSQAVKAAIVTSFAISVGTRDASGAWSPNQSRRLLTYTRSIGGRIAAAEFMNEPDLPIIGGAPEGYDTAAFGRDFRIFHGFMKAVAPDLLILGPGTISESSAASALLASTGQELDVVSYHYYGALSERCNGSSGPRDALSEQWLSLTDRSFALYQTLRDRYEPGRPIWLTETAEAACGGNPWAASFIDTFRYLDQLGRLSAAGVQVVMHNTLAASDYGLLDEDTLQPRPNYWGALLWRRLMGTVVLDAGVPQQSGLHVYAHCQRDIAGGVALLVINTDREASHTMMLPTASVRYTLDAEDLMDRQVRLNGRRLTLDGEDLPSLQGAGAAATTLTFGPATITFLAVPEAANQACQ